MKWLHNLLRGLSLTGALFVFQACYGTPQRPLTEEEQEVALVEDGDLEETAVETALPDSTFTHSGETLIQP